MSALLAGALIVGSTVGCGYVGRAIVESVPTEPRERVAPDLHARRGALTPRERRWAEIAWRYFERNTDAQTGLVHSSDSYPTVTPYQIGDSLVAVVAARDLGVINEQTYRSRLSALVRFTASMPLAAGELPNRNYNTTSGAMVDFANQPGSVGWSAVEIGRLLVALAVVHERAPELRPDIERAVARWSFCRVIDRCGRLYAASAAGADFQLRRDGWLGPEEYAAAGFALWGFDVREAAELAPVSGMNVYGVELLRDARSESVLGTAAPLTTEPFALFRFELGGTTTSAFDGAEYNRIGELLLRAEERRAAYDEIPTARAVHAVSEAPWFVQDAVYVGGSSFNTIAADGTERRDLALASTRAAFFSWALYEGSYSESLIEQIGTANDPDRGWYEGIRERTRALEPALTLTTNAQVLLAIRFKALGPLATGLAPLRAAARACPPGQTPECGAPTGEVKIAAAPVAPSAPKLPIATPTRQQPPATVPTSAAPVASVKPPSSPTVAPTSVAPAATEKLTSDELAAARTAFAYFERNRQANGLVNSDDGYGFTTMWDVGSSIQAYVAARELGLIDAQRLVERLRPLFRTLATMPLYDGALPNREYLTARAEMTSLAHVRSGRGSGWSALDVGRLLIALKVVERNVPELAPDVRTVVNRFKLDRAVRDGELVGARLSDGREALNQEGRFGYEQYAAAGFGLWGTPAPRALDLNETKTFELHGVTARHDRRERAFLTSTPFYLGAIELGSGVTTELADEFYELQRRRAQEVHRLVALDEDAFSREPWFVYCSIFYVDGFYRCAAPSGRVLPEFEMFSTKAAFAWSVLFADDYAKSLRARALQLIAPGRGFYAGVTRSGEVVTSMNVNTNAVILESLWFKARGRTPLTTGGGR